MTQNVTNFIYNYINEKLAGWTCLHINDECLQHFSKIEKKNTSNKQKHVHNISTTKLQDSLSLLIKVAHNI